VTTAPFRVSPWTQVLVEGRVNDVDVNIVLSVMRGATINDTVTRRRQRAPPASILLDVPQSPQQRAATRPVGLSANRPGRLAPHIQDIQRRSLCRYNVLGTRRISRSRVSERVSLTPQTPRIRTPTRRLVWSIISSNNSPNGYSGHQAV